MKWWLKNQSANSHLKSVFEIPENAFKKECRHSIWLDQDMVQQRISQKGMLTRHLIISKNGATRNLFATLLF